MGKLEGRVVVVSGAARGQGAAEARLFAAEGARVLLGDVLDDQGERVAAELGPARARYVHLDVRDEASWRAAADAALEAFGKVDGLVNNAGILRFNGLATTPVEEFREVVAVNQTGCFLGMKTLAPHIARAGGGTIVNTASYAALSGMAFLTAYAATKGAILSMTRVAALELADRGIRVNAMCPGAIDTPMANPRQAEAGGLRLGGGEKATEEASGGRLPGGAASEGQVPGGQVPGGEAVARGSVAGEPARGEGSAGGAPDAHGSASNTDSGAAGTDSGAVGADSSAAGTDGAAAVDGMAVDGMEAFYAKLIPQGRMGRPEEVARLALFLSCADSSYVTGQPFVIDGGWLAGVPVL
ncbi:SDR family oxidoreductase [Streptomyces albus subsp. chlorinus]|uniref:SDR family oxidoreductase n=1 Tax=Streptomyces albus TaxID=1888 RepID=UPI0015704357|nr:SDR family oxidoreductase [Streptomyces albus]NSC22279.1 SDR family oxidoreductase [Streptomyces albus subsp. chlorinus]